MARFSICIVQIPHFRHGSHFLGCWLFLDHFPCMYVTWIWYSDYLLSTASDLTALLCPNNQLFVSFHLKTYWWNTKQNIVWFVSLHAKQLLDSPLDSDTLRSSKKRFFIFASSLYFYSSWICFLFFCFFPASHNSCFVTPHYFSYK